MRLMMTAAITFLLAAGPLAAEQVKVTITKRDCARLVRHSPSADVAYQPGVDAKGRKVVPADLPGSGGEMKVLPDVLQFPISINPVGWAQRNAAMKDKATAEAAIAANHDAEQAARTALTALQTAKTKLTKSATTLSGELSALETTRDSLQADVTALEAQVTAGTLSNNDVTLHRKRNSLTAQQALVDAKQAEVDANTTAQTKNTENQATQQAIIDAAPDTETAKSIDRVRAESTLSSLSSRGLDDVSMTVGTVAYDIARGTMTWNGQPLGTAEQQEIAEACRKMGVR